MKKIEIDKKKVKKLIKKAIPWVIGGGVVAIGGVILYKKGFTNGVNTGMHNGVDLTIKAIVDHICEPNNFCIYNNSKNIPVVVNGVAVTCTDDVETAVKVMETISPSEKPEFIETSIKQLTDIIFDNKRPIKITNF